MAVQMAAVRLPAAAPSLRSPASAAEASWRIHSFALLCFLAAAIAFMAVTLRSSEPSWNGVIDVERFGVSTQSSGRYLVAAVRTAEVTVPDLDAMRVSQRFAMKAALRCTGARGVDALTMNARGVGGPSGGLMFALALIDRMDPRDLAHGLVVAGTGAIRPDGAVLRVGRVAEKAAAAEAAGADLFLVPFGQFAEAEAATSSLDMIGVRSVDEAVEALSGIGCAAPLPPTHLLRTSNDAALG